MIVVPGRHAVLESGLYPEIIRVYTTYIIITFADNFNTLTVAKLDAYLSLIIIDVYHGFIDVCA